MHKRRSYKQHKYKKWRGFGFGILTPFKKYLSCVEVAEKVPSRYFQSTSDSYAKLPTKRWLFWAFSWLVVVSFSSLTYISFLLPLFLYVPAHVFLQCSLDSLLLVFVCGSLNPLADDFFSSEMSVSSSFSVTKEKLSLCLFSRPLILVSIYPALWL